MFKEGDYIVCLLDKMNGEYIVYKVLKKHKKSQLYDIESTKTKLVYKKVFLPSDYYVKLEPAI